MLANKTLQPTATAPAVGGGVGGQSAEVAVAPRLPVAVAELGR